MIQSQGGKFDLGAIFDRFSHSKLLLRTWCHCKPLVLSNPSSVYLRLEFAQLEVPGEGWSLNLLALPSSPTPHQDSSGFIKQIKKRTSTRPFINPNKHKSIKIWSSCFVRAGQTLEYAQTVLLLHMGLEGSNFILVLRMSPVVTAKGIVTFTDCNPATRSIGATWREVWGKLLKHKLQHTLNGPHLWKS